MPNAKKKAAKPKTRKYVRWLVVDEDGREWGSGPTRAEAVDCKKWHNEQYSFVGRFRLIKLTGEG